jgi:hypothetical protein
VLRLFGKKKNPELNFSLIYPTHQDTPVSHLEHVPDLDIWQITFQDIFSGGKIGYFYVSGDSWVLLRQWRQLGTFTSVATADSPHLRNTHHLHCFLFCFSRIRYGTAMAVKCIFVLARSNVVDSKRSYSSSGPDLSDSSFINFERVYINSESDQFSAFWALSPQKLARNRNPAHFTPSWAQLAHSWAH